jgi:hypothetical protein
MSDKDGDYCQVCGGISPGKVKTKSILIGGQAIGIDSLDVIMDEVKALDLSDDEIITAELLKWAKIYNYVPTKRATEYGEALLREYKSCGSKD